jgi:UDP-glucose 6-dehydrogenase
MKVTIFGWGYVGCATAACLADHGQDVTGVNIDGNKVEMINHSQSPIIEPGYGHHQKRINAGRLRATADAAELGARWTYADSVWPID